MSLNPDTPEFIRTQFAFARHLRDPEKYPAPVDIEDRRMKIYRELFYNNVEDFMASSFPVLRQITADDVWHAMIRDYFAHHRATTPLFPEMPREFIQYLENERQAQSDDFPFLLELAHYEWVELALALIDEVIEWNSYTSDSELLNSPLQISPLAWVLEYQYPVHMIGSDYIPQSPGESPTYIIVYRNRDDDIGFIEINPVTAGLLTLITQYPDQTGLEHLEKLAEQLNHSSPETVISAGLEILNNLQQRDIVLAVTNLHQE